MQVNAKKKSIFLGSREEFCIFNFSIILVAISRNDGPMVGILVYDFSDL